MLTIAKENTLGNIVTILFDLTTLKMCCVANTDPNLKNIIWRVIVCIPITRLKPKQMWVTLLNLSILQHGFTWIGNQIKSNANKLKELITDGNSDQTYFIQ